jgi:hypothetical protein
MKAACSSEKWHHNPEDHQMDCCQLDVTVAWNAMTTIIQCVDTEESH